MPTAYSNFFAISTQASAALIGLLFVSVSIAPANIFGSKAAAEHQFLALSAFTALVNAFFLSFASLLPMPHVGITAIVLGTLALSETVALLFLLPTWKRDSRLLRGLSILVISVGVYSYELVVGIVLARTPSDLKALSQLLGFLLGAFALGLFRAWQLLGASRERGLASQLGALVQRQTRLTTSNVRRETHEGSGTLEHPTSSESERS